MNILGYELVQTCGACPEQYDVFKEGKQVGYLRLRHGSFRADVPYPGGTTVYTASPRGDGCFDPDEQEFYLTQAIQAIDKELNKLAGEATTNEFILPCPDCGAKLTIKIVDSIPQIVDSEHVI